MLKADTFPMTKPLTSTTIVVPRKGVDKDGVIVPTWELAQRLRWLTALTQQAATIIVGEHWNVTSMATLASGVDRDGKRLPAKASAAARRLGYTATLDHAYLPDRAYRCAEEQAVRTLRGAQHRSELTRLLLDTWPVDPRKRTSEEWDQLRGLASERELDLSNTDVRNRTRNIMSYLNEHKVLPADIYELETAPHVAGEVLLAASDKELVTYAHVGETIELEVKLPLVPTPQSRKDWKRVRFFMPLGSHVPEHAVLSPPTVRVTPTGIRVNVPWSIPVPDRLALTGKNHPGHVRAIGADWGVNSLLTAVVGTIDNNRAEYPTIRTDGRAYKYKGSGIVLKGHRLRKGTECLTARIKHQDTLLESFPVPYYDTTLANKRDLLMLERDHVSRKRSALNKELAWSAATWLVDLAVLRKATVIYVEELSSLEGRGLGTRQNTRVSNQVRGKVLEALRHQAAKHGISVVTVPARGTSATCSRCLASHKHVVSPDRRTAGHAWAYCGYCGHSSDRDHGAAERIVSRGLAAQHSTFGDNIRKILDVKVRVTRESLSRKISYFQKVKTRDRAESRHARAKSGPTLSQVPPRGKKQGGKRSALLVPVTERAKALNVQCLTGTSCSEVSVDTKQAGSTLVSVSPGSSRRSRRLRRVQGRGFHPLSYPTYVPWVRTLVTPRRVLSTPFNLT